MIFCLKFRYSGIWFGKAAVAKFTRTTGTMLSSGVAILDALEIVAKTAGNKTIEKAVLDTRTAIAEGRTMSDPLAESGVFPSMVCQMIAVGESTGALDAMLTKIAEFYEEEVDQAVENLTALIEPFMIVFWVWLSAGWLWLCICLFSKWHRWCKAPIEHMSSSSITPEDDLYHKLKWLMFFRILFASLLLGSTIIVQLKENSFPPDKSFIFLHGLIVTIFLLSIYYAFIFRTEKIRLLFPYIQIGIDTLLVTLIIFITGSFTSIFSFLYLVIIIYSSMIIFRKGSMIMASFCSIQYGILINLEYYGIIVPYFAKESSSIGNYAWSLVFFKVVITMVACFAVAFLSGLLSEQLRRTKKELSVMEERVERVEKMAYLGEMAAA